MPLILPGNVASATAAVGYNIANSCRFDRADTPELTRDIGEAGSLVAGTINVWFKYSADLQSQNPILWAYNASPATSANLQVGGATTNGTEIVFYSQRAGESPGEPTLITTAHHRDPSAWYNIHTVWDSANGTAADRMRIYINGTRITILDQETLPQQNSDWGMFNYADGVRITNISNKPYGGAGHFNGYLANIIVCDGQTYEPTKFGEFNEDSPTIWQPIDPEEQSLTFGTNGFWLDFADSAALGNDVSGNNNDYTPANLAAVDQCTDTPTNNFCTGNPLVYTTMTSFTQGNNQIYNSASAHKSGYATMPVSAGKWYWEAEIDVVGVTSTIGVVAVDASFNLNQATYFYIGEFGFGFKNEGKKNNNAGVDADITYGSSWSAGDIIGVALDMDNLKLYFSIGGTWQDSGDPESGATGTNAAWTLDAGYNYVPAFHTHQNTVWKCNFGATSFGETAISSANADGNGYGAFEYAVPSGYMALCTKNLGSDGG